MSKEDNTNLFEVLERGDRKISEVLERGIIMVGLTRAGKSTTFNWTLGKPMIGVGEDEDDCHYINVVEHDQDAA
jgi:50S ribosomal subunit-associated GTPase HflX